MSDCSNKTRYYLIACGTSKYNNFKELDLDSVPTDIEKIVNLFTQNFGYEQILTNFQLNPNANDLKIEFANWLQNKERCETDCLIFYYSGHGEDLQGDRHYLLMENTNPNQIGQTALPTEDLVRPLKNEGVKIAQILYIIDTCYSQSGAVDVTNFASKVIQQFQPVTGANIAVHSIAACRAKQTAQEGLFSQAFEQVITDYIEKPFKGRYINPSELVEKINQKIRSQTQHVVYNTIGSETSAKLFPILPTTLQTWEKESKGFVTELLIILKKDFERSFFFIHPFLLSSEFSEFIDEFVSDERDLTEKLTDLSLKPVSDGICPLIACSQWCRVIFLKDQNTETTPLSKEIAQNIKEWQNKVIESRKEVNLDKIRQFINSRYSYFKSKIQKEDFRIQIEIEPEIDQNNTGLATGSFVLNVNLWIQSQDSPFGRFAEKLPLKPQEIEQNDSNNSGTLKSCLENKNLLSKLIHQARYSLDVFVESQKVEKPKIEVFLPFNAYQEPLEKILFNFGTDTKELGLEYQIFINSFERYFDDQDFRELRDAIYKKKKALWSNDNKNDNNLDSDIYYIGTDPLIKDLEMIERDLPIAVWSRNANNPLVEGDKGHIKISEWKNWPEKIHDLRNQLKDLEITLFWDDLYPKPSRRHRPLNTKVVE